ncbi:carbohydrate-binding family 9-like protein [Flavobacterium sp. DG2-3]|uniref:carbohydrate-binding family 9-like protein n=1 Tax=Flavobacterium sp. DG2-3 TaxID=3068317 RepID=UPI00273FA2FA|nr:carbohydrate-binding family 9-like protein [Flavobacterium sp. DG2-3]MDP5199994.1 carbohydrate-binding family 9-like protein [Flavobacterium sp. DG2-3]
MKEYQVILIDKNQENENEILNPVFWKKANCLTDFSSPWNNDPVLKIEFRALWDQENFYFNFRVFDNDVYIDQKDDSVDSICNSDRVELFFRSNDSLNPYYCLEIDPSTRLLDFHALPDKVFDYEWKWPQNHIKLESSADEVSFTVAGAISIGSLKELDLVHNNTIETGVYRAKFSKGEKGNYEPTWISWVNPITPEPNFHIASSFGKFILQK